MGYPETIQELFLVGMKRNVPQILAPDPSRGIVLELGAGYHPMPGTIGLDYPSWNGVTDPIPYPDESCAGIYAFHFFEHFTGEQAIQLLRECERVLVPGGVLTIVVPHARSLLAEHDLDHKSRYVIDTWRILFNAMYAKNRERPWQFRIELNIMMGIVERNLALLTQLVKT